MRHKIRYSLSIILTESWTVVWENKDAPPTVAPDAGSHLITWEEGEDPPAVIILRRSAEGSGWQMKSEQQMID